MIMKGDLSNDQHQRVWKEHPLPPFALVYAWQDVAWCDLLYRRQRELLEQRGLFNMQMELSRDVAERANNNPPPANVGALRFVIHGKGGFYLKRNSSQAQLKIHALEGRCDAPAAVSLQPWVDVVIVGMCVEPPRPVADVGGMVKELLARALLGESKESLNDKRTLLKQCRVSFAKRRWRGKLCYVDVVVTPTEAVEGLLDQAGLVWFDYSEAQRWLLSGPTPDDATLLHRTHLAALGEGRAIGQEEATREQRDEEVEMDSIALERTAEVVDIHRAVLAATRDKGNATDDDDSDLPPLHEEHCRFVSVVVHDGTKALYLCTAKKVPMGGLNDEVASITGTASADVFWGTYAAWMVVRSKLGALWESGELNISKEDMRLVGATSHRKQHTAWYELKVHSLDELAPALQRAYERRDPTPDMARTFTGLAFLVPASIATSSTDGATIASIVAGRAQLRAVVPKILDVPRVLDSTTLQRDDPAYQAAIDTNYESRVFHDWVRGVHTFHPIPPKVMEGEGEDAIHTSKHRSRSGVRLEARRLMFDDEDEAVENPEEGEAAAVPDEAAGRQASYSERSHHPQADDPAAFWRRLRPAGLDRDFLQRMASSQLTDDFCTSTLASLQAYDRLCEAWHISCKVGAVGSRARLRMSFAVPLPSGSAERRNAERLQRLARQYRVSEEGVLLRRDEDREGKEVLRYVVPQDEELRQMLLISAHDGMLHLGRKRTLDALRASGVWWASMGKDVKQFVRGCDTCALNKLIPRHGAMLIPPNGTAPWQVVSVDVVDLEDTSAGNRKAVIFNDRYSRAVRAYAVPVGLTSEMFLNLVALALIPDVGCPLIMISDRGSNLVSALCQEFYKHFGNVEMRIADSHMHTAVALTERFNSTLREMARAAWFDNKCEWDLFLPYLVLYYNATIQESTGYSPFFIEHGREPHLPWQPPRILEDTTNVNEYVRRHLFGLHLAWETVHANLDEAEARRKELYDSRHHTNVHFAPGDRVLVLQPGRSSKMDMPYVGPYRVLWGPDERDRYALRDIEGRRWNEFHVSKLKHWPLTDDLTNEYYVVEKILDVRLDDSEDGEHTFLVKWKGYNSKYNTWEPLNNLNAAAVSDALDVLAARRAENEHVDSSTRVAHEGGEQRSSTAVRAFRRRRGGGRRTVDDTENDAARRAAEASSSAARADRAARRAAARTNRVSTSSS